MSSFQWSIIYDDSCLYSLSVVQDVSEERHPRFGLERLIMAIYMSVHTLMGRGTSSPNPLSYGEFARRTISETTVVVPRKTSIESRKRPNRIFLLLHIP